MAQHMIIAGGSGFIGRYLARHFIQYGYQVTILTRNPDQGFPAGVTALAWDGENPGLWQKALDGADVLINLAGKSVNCRYTPENRQAIHDSRVFSTQILAETIRQCSQPPRVWLNASTATIYRYSEDKDMTESTGELVDDFSTSVAKDWEDAFFEGETPHTRRIALRTSIVLAKDEGALPRLVNLARTGMGGAQGHGRQYVSWIHIEDMLRIVDWLIESPHAGGVYNCTAPQPIPNQAFMAEVRGAVGVPFGLPMPKPLLEFGALLIGTETELILKSRRVVPERLEQEGFRFLYPNAGSALRSLLGRKRGMAEKVLTL